MKDKKGIIIIVLIIIVIIVIAVLGLIISKRMLASKQESSSGIENPIQNSQNVNRLVQNTVTEAGQNVFNHANQMVQDATPKIEETAKQSFNKQFDSYEGTIKGSSTRALISIVRTSNVSHTDCQVAVEYNGQEYSKDAELSNLIENVNSKNSYIISFNFDVNGYINKINISE